MLWRLCNFFDLMFVVELSLIDISYDDLLFDDDSSSDASLLNTQYFLQKYLLEINGVVIYFLIFLSVTLMGDFLVASKICFSLIVIIDVL